jgi:16S rRNA (adenine1518-N6/adenine1519-N6)-dimethyltransferase
VQTKHDIQFLLESAGIRPNKRLGQHFLIDLNLLTKLVQTADVAKDDVVLEVGCGTGSLTQALAERAGKVVAVEIDPTLSQIAAQQLEEKSNVQILNTDILENKHNLSNVVSNAIASARGENKGRFLLVANLPYNAASGVMINLITAPLDSPLSVDAMYVTVQKEVAERMTAKPDSKEYGTLSIFLNAAGDVKLLRTLKPSVFWPQPQVNSAMISFIRNEDKVRRIGDIDIFSRLVGLFMQHRRKMLKAIVKFATGDFAKTDWEKLFERCGIDPRKRPENLRPDEFLCLANLCSIPKSL